MWSILNEEIPRYLVYASRSAPAARAGRRSTVLRGDTDIAERIRYDIWYIENWTVALDIKIISAPCSAARWSTTKNYNNALCVTGRECL